MSSVNHRNLITTVIELSCGNTWERAVSEWYIYDCEEDEYHESSCVCGKENLRYLFTIKNMINGNEIYPIGSSCIRKFGRIDLNVETSIHEKLFQLFHAVENHEYISLSSKYFSRKLLQFLYEEGAFKDNEYNHYNGEDDYYFMLQMFNKRNKNSISFAQQRKISAIIMNSIKPFLNEKLKGRIHY